MAVVASPHLDIRVKEQRDDGFIAELAGSAFGEYSRSAREAIDYTVGATYRESTRTFVAELGGRPVGFVLLEFGWPQGAGVNAIAVVAEERGKGVGHRLLETAERCAAQRGERKVTAYTAQANVAALDLFFRRGFVIRRRISQFYRSREDACMLEKAL